MENRIRVYLNLEHSGIDWECVYVPVQVFQLPETENNAPLTGHIHARYPDSYMTENSPGVLLEFDVCEVDHWKDKIAFHVIDEKGISMPIGVVDLFYVNEDSEIKIDFSLPDLDIRVGTYSNTKSIRKVLARRICKPYLMFKVGEHAAQDANPKIVNISSIEWQALVIKSRVSFIK